MDRIRKLVAKSKAEKKVSEGTNNVASRETITSNNKEYNYTSTKTVSISMDAMKKNRIIATDPTDPRATRFQVLRTKVLQQMRKKKWNALAVSAPTPGAGKSLIAANLAACIAQEGNQSVLLVDMDLRKPSIHKYFDVKPENGIHDYLDGTAQIEETMINPGMQRLVLLPGRRGVLNSSEQISTPFVKNFVNEIRSRYDDRLVIFDLPPILVADDVMVFLPYIDCSILVVESGKNTKKEVEESLEIIGSNPLLGTVLNKCDNVDDTFIY